MMDSLEIIVACDLEITFQSGAILDLPCPSVMLLFRPIAQKYSPDVDLEKFMHD